MDGSKVPDGRDACGQFHGVELEVRTFPGAKAVRVLHAHGQKIAAHEHDWVCITIPLLGSGLETFDGGEAEIGAGSAVLHPPGGSHADHIGSRGLETISIQFDPRWDRTGDYRPFDRSSAGSGGKVALLAGRLARAWTRSDLGEAQLKASTFRFVHEALSAPPPPAPAWLQYVRKAAEESPSATSADLAREVAIHPAWLARSYRQVVGEGLSETRRRRRVEEAVHLLRNSDLALAEVAAHAGFCDQSHMNRNFREILDRTPLQVRYERKLLAQLERS